MDWGWTKKRDRTLKHATNKIIRMIDIVNDGEKVMDPCKSNKQLQFAT